MFSKGNFLVKSYSLIRMKILYGYVAMELTPKKCTTKTTLSPKFGREGRGEGANTLKEKRFSPLALTLSPLKGRGSLTLAIYGYSAGI